MAVIRVARKPTESTNKLAAIGLLVARAMPAAGAEVSPVAEQVVAHVKPEMKKKRARKAYTSEQRALISNTMRWMFTMQNPASRDTLTNIAAALPGAIRHLGDVNNTISSLGASDDASLGLDTETGDLFSKILQKSAALHFAEEFGNPETYKTIPKTNVSNHNVWTSELDQFINLVHSTNVPTAKAREIKYKDQQGFKALQDEIAQHMNEYSVSKRAEKVNTRPSQDFRQLLANVDRNNRSTDSKRSTDVSARQWRRYHAAINRAYKSNRVRPSKMMDFICKLSGLRAKSDDQLEMLTAVSSVVKSYHGAINFSDHITKKQAHAHAVWEGLSEFVLPRIAKNVQSTAKINLTEGLLSKYESWLGSLSAPSKNPLQAVVNRLEKVNEQGLNINWEKTGTVDPKFSAEYLLTCSNADFVKLMRGAESTANGQTTYANDNTSVETLIKNNWYAIVENRLLGGQVQWQKVNPSPFAYRLLSGRMQRAFHQ